ncbi:MAG: hypothetical protein KatS3mg119_1992 [Rhodothalassiaceae bacterium]|nr:MAG: hypothetical protein KatS3mg119_1992 [Rhodothalassiaceae bacterium]
MEGTRLPFAPGALRSCAAPDAVGVLMLNDITVIMEGPVQVSAHVDAHQKDQGPGNDDTKHEYAEGHLKFHQPSPSFGAAATRCCIWMGCFHQFARLGSGSELLLVEWSWKAP